MAYAQ